MAKRTGDGGAWSNRVIGENLSGGANLIQEGLSMNNQNYIVVGARIVAESLEFVAARSIKIPIFIANKIGTLMRNPLVRELREKDYERERARRVRERERF